MRRSLLAAAAAAALLGGRRLKPGRYRLTAAPVGGTARQAEFRVR